MGCIYVYVYARVVTVRRRWMDDDAARTPWDGRAGEGYARGGVVFIARQLFDFSCV